MSSKPQAAPQPPPPYLPPLWEPADATALQALAKGTADADQQKRALNWIVNGASNTYDLEYRPDSRDHAFASGRRFVGLQIIKLLKVIPGKFVKP